MSAKRRKRHGPEEVSCGSCGMRIRCECGEVSRIGPVRSPNRQADQQWQL